MKLAASLLICESVLLKRKQTLSWILQFEIEDLWYLLSPDCDTAYNWTRHWSEVKFPSTEGGSVNKENPQQTLSVVVAVWISIAVLPVKIVNLKKDHYCVKTN